MKRQLQSVLLGALLLPAIAAAEVITFDFTGRLVVAGSTGGIISGNASGFTPIAASLIYDTDSGIGNSSLSITLTEGFLGSPATFHDISMSSQTGSNLISGNVLVDWDGNFDMPLDIEWDASGLFNAIDYGLQAGHVLSGSDLYFDSNGNGIQDTGEFIQDIASATPYSDSLLTNVQGPAPLAATVNSQGLGQSTPFPGIRGYFDIGSGNSMHVTAVSSVPVPAAVWLFATGLLGLLGVARRK
ncbi:MAG: VPLPA-CTERM sorting domain-containing protein [Gammaproteobacteria bacterium]